MVAGSLGGFRERERDGLFGWLVAAGFVCMLACPNDCMHLMSLLVVCVVVVVLVLFSTQHRTQLARIVFVRLAACAYFA